MTADLTGAWLGRYAYPGGRAVPFEAEIVQAGAAIDGRVREPNTFAAGGPGELIAEIGGWVDGGTLRFTKRYENADSGGDPEYAGRLSRDGMRVAGSWSFPGRPGAHGTFTMSRKPRAEARAKRREGALAPR